jgi:hypothetical protein
MTPSPKPFINSQGYPTDSPSNGGVANSSNPAAGGGGGGGGGGDAPADAGSAFQDILRLNAPGAAVPGGGVQPGAFGPGQPGGQGAYTPSGDIALANGGTTVNGTMPAAAAPNPALANDPEHSMTVQNRAYTQNGMEYLTRPEMIGRLQSAGNAQNLNGMTNTELAQMMSNAYSTGQQNAYDQRQQQQQGFDNNQASLKTQTGELQTLENLLASSPALAPQLVPLLNQLFAAMGLPQLPPNEAQLLMATLASSSLGGRAAPAHIAFAPLGG